MTNENIAALESIIDRKAEERKAKAAAKAAAAAARIAKSGGADTKMKADRLAAIILCAKCDFGADGYNKYLSCCTALYHVAGVSSEVIAAWGSSYDRTQQNPRQWETMNRNGTFTKGTLIWAAELLNPTAFNSYKNELKGAATASEDFSSIVQTTAEDTNGGTPADVPSKEPAPVIEDLEKIDFIKGKAIYYYIEHFLDTNTGELDEIGLTDYCGELEARAEELKCKGTYKNRMNARVKNLEKKAKITKEQHTAAQLDRLREDLPVWVIPTQSGVNKVDEIAFTDSFLEKHGEIKCINYVFYDVNGELPRNQIENKIHNQISPYITQGVALRTRALCDCLALKCYSEPIQPDKNKIHVKNGTLTYKTSTTTGSDGNEYAKSGFEFSPNKEFCLCRMNVEYTGTFRRPDKWHAFLDDLLEPDDQKTLQEYMGYCMLPTTEAQTALFIIGQGGEGKSVIGAIMKDIFGSGMVSGQVHKLDNGNGSRFALAPLVNRLVMCDDDIKLGALEETAVFKQIVTAQIPLEVEQKGLPSYQALLYSRIIAFGNGALSSLYDNSEGFWRRQLILSALPKKRSEDEDNPNIINELLTEKDLIFNWALQGLERLMKNNFKFHVSERTKQNIEMQKRESDSILDFIESDAVTVDGNPARCIEVRKLYEAYQNWCYNNMKVAKSERTFYKWLTNNAARYGLKSVDHVPKTDGSRGNRGYRGIGEMTAIPAYNT